MFIKIYIVCVQSEIFFVKLYIEKNSFYIKNNQQEEKRNRL